MTPGTGQEFGVVARAAGHRRRSACRGLTLVELVLGLVITSFISAAIGAMLISVSAGVSHQRETRACTVSHAVASIRVGEALRSAKMVLAMGPDYVVLWMPEAWPNGMVNLSEFVRIERDPAAEELVCYRAPPNLAEADDTAYDLAATDFDAVTSALRGTPFFPRRLWASGVTGWATTTTTTDPREARYVGYRITMSLDGVAETTFGGAALRN